MRKKIVAVALFIEGENILIQDRKELNKYGTEYGFFGGKIEEGETPEQAVKREIKEELEIDMANYKFFKHFKKQMPELDLEIEYYMFIAPLPNQKEIKCNEGKPFFTNFNKALKLKMIPGDIELLKEIYEQIKKK